MSRDDKMGGPNYPFESRPPFFRIELVLRIYSRLGLLIALLAVGYLVLSLLPYSLTENQKTAAAVAGVGLTLAVISRALIEFRREQVRFDNYRFLEKELAADFIEAWSKFEKQSKSTLDDSREKFERHSIRSIISKLHSDNKINELDVKALEEALEVRNSIVHGGERPPIPYLKKVTSVLDNIITKIASPLLP